MSDQSAAPQNSDAQPVLIKYINKGGPFHSIMSVWQGSPSPIFMIKNNAGLINALLNI